MNQQVKNLVKKSGGEFWQRLENDVVNQEAFITFDPPESLERFVGMIVEECCQVLSKESIRHDGYGYNQHDLYQKMRQHLGVE